jgi:hypothetical protein
VAPSFSAPDLFPQAAKANHAIFYTELGARSVGQVYDLLVTKGAAGGLPAGGQGYFLADSSLGSWSPKVEKIITLRPRASAEQMASASFPLASLFGGASQKQNTQGSAQTGSREADSGWTPSVAPGEGLGKPIIDMTESNQAATNPPPTLLRPATASETALGVTDAESAQDSAATAAPAADLPRAVTIGGSSQRLKIIHVAEE